MPLLLFLFLATTLTISHGSEHTNIPNQIHPLRPQSGARGSNVAGLSCLSWRFGVETNNIIDWNTVPKECGDYVGHYMLGGQYRNDSRVVANEAILYAESLSLGKDGKDIWIFDTDETALSNVPYYAENGFGLTPYNSTLFNAWVLKGKAPALPETLNLYKKLMKLGIKVVFLTGRPDSQRDATAKNLKKAGYKTWEKLILRKSSESGKAAVEYKSGHRKKLEESGYRIVGNIGDQWSDLIGTNPGKRTFKLPDPMYYIG
ncbi:Acid phosphatase (Class B) [Corchorus olitorius]|uniref:Acid phosphatase (Class B) n=1 Tax=Corchorus olitorius TaxID=93759 RepID=A0A1R3H7Z5_9ROSI|nr:Acid phosphatase (Class B) [Corchorus olitorius]